MKSPAFQFYPDDFRGSGKVGTMTTEEIGAYVLLLCLDWNETGFPYDEEELARWCLLTRAKFRKAWVRVSRCFVERDGRLYNPRLDVERTKQEEWRAKSRKGGVASGEARAKGGSTTDPTTDEPPPPPPTQPKGNTPFPSLSLTPETATATTPAPPAAPRRAVVTWITPYCAAWKARFGGDMPIKPATVPLSRLRLSFGDAEVVRRWIIYLAATEAPYASASRFASTWDHWGVPPPARPNGGKPSAGEAMAASMKRIFTPTTP